MSRRYALLVFVGLSLVVGGCNKGTDRANDGARPAEQQSGVAIVDLDEVARRLGSDVSIVQAIQESQASLNRQLQSLQVSLQDQYQEQKRLVEGQLAEGAQDQAAVKQLQGFGQQLNVQFSQAQQKAKSEINTRRGQLLQRFREEVKPVAQELAAQRGLGVVITKNDSVLLTFDDAHDITDAVVEKLLSRRAVVQSANPATVVTRPAPASSTQR